MSRVFSGERPIPNAEQQQFQSLQFQQADSLAAAARLSAAVGIDLTTQFAEVAKLTVPVVAMRQRATERADQDSYQVAPVTWFASATERIDSISEISHAGDAWALEHTNSVADDAQQRIWLVLLASAAILGFVATTLWLVISQNRRRVRAEEALRLEAAIAEIMAEGVLITRLNDAMIVYVNPTLERMFDMIPAK